MKYHILIFLLFSLVTQSAAQDFFGLEELKVKSKEFTEYVLSQGQSLNAKVPANLVPLRIKDFKLEGKDSLAMVNIDMKSVEYYDFLVSYQKQTGITTNNLCTIFLDSVNDTPIDLKCFKDWYLTEAHTIAVTLACYQSEISSVKESCIARSIQATLINNANVAKCFNALDKK